MQWWLKNACLDGYIPTRSSPHSSADGSNLLWSKWCRSASVHQFYANNFIDIASWRHLWLLSWHGCKFSAHSAELWLDDLNIWSHYALFCYTLELTQSRENNVFNLFFLSSTLYAWVLDSVCLIDNDCVHIHLYLRWWRSILLNFYSRCNHLDGIIRKCSSIILPHEALMTFSSRSST